MSCWSRSASKLSIIIVTGIKWKLMISFNRFEIKIQIKCVITAHKSFKSPLNTILALQGKYQKIKITQKGLIKIFHFRLILTLEQYNWIGILSTWLIIFFSNHPQPNPIPPGIWEIFYQMGGCSVNNWCLTYKLQLISPLCWTVK